jgi:AraC-like DNA-binding protein
MTTLNAPVPEIFIKEAVECARHSGIDGLGIARAIAPDAARNRMTLEEYGRFWFALAQEMGDEMLGMAHDPMRPGSFAVLCHAIRGTTTLGQALRRALWVLEVMLGSPHGTVTIRSGQAQITLAENDEPMSAFAYRTLLIVLLGPICWLARRRIDLLEVAFRCPAPAGAIEYSRFFGTPVQFSASETRVVIRADHLSLPVNRSEAALKRYLKDAPGNLLVGYQGGDDLTGQIRKILKTKKPQQWPDFNRIASHLKMSPSTLRRRLKTQGASFRDIKSEVRQTLAKRLLIQSDLPVAQVSDQLGYTEPSAFFRAFHAWTGMSPARFRDQEHTKVITSDLNVEIPE